MIRQFLEMYSHGVSIKEMKPLETEEYKAFISKRGWDVRIVSSVKHLEWLPHEESYYNYFNNNKIFWMIPIDFPDGSIGGFVLRSYMGKDYSLYNGGVAGQVLYGWHDFGEFRRGNPIILVEGVKDREFIAGYYPYVLACLSSGPSGGSIELLRGLTDKIILAFDNDDTGKEQTIRVAKRMSELGCTVMSITPKYVKDWGAYYMRTGMGRLLQIDLLEVLPKLGYRFQKSSVEK